MSDRRDQNVNILHYIKSISDEDQTLFEEWRGEIEEWCTSLSELGLGYDDVVNLANNISQLAHKIGKLATSRLPMDWWMA